MPTLNGGNRSTPAQPELTPPDERICPACLGMRFIVSDSGGSKPSRAVQCPLGCNHEAAQAQLNRLCGLAGEQLKLGFKHSWNPRIAPAVNAILESLAEEPPAGFILLSGPYGCGKSHLLAAAVNAAISKRWSAVYFSSEELLDHFRRAYAPNSETTYDGLYNRVVNATVLCLDEFERTSSTDWAQSQMFKLLDARFEAALYGSNGGRKLTVLATNSPRQSLDPYLLSRLSDVRAGRFFDLTGAPDMRQLQKAPTR